MKRVILIEDRLKEERHLDRDIRKDRQQFPPVVNVPTVMKALGDVERRAHDFFISLRRFAAPFVSVTVADTTLEQMRQQRISFQLNVSCP